jgi:Na+/H+ antiporter NhaC
MLVFGFCALANQPEVSVQVPSIIIKGISQQITITDVSKKGLPVDTSVIVLNGNTLSVILKHGEGTIPFVFTEKTSIKVSYYSQQWELPVNPIPQWFGIIPPLLAILIALVFREVYSALFIGLLVGTTTIAFYQGSSFLGAVFVGVFRIMDTYVIQALNESSHLSIIVFSMMIGAMVSIISINGGMKGIVAVLSKRAASPRSGMFITFLLDLCIFFDDYSNTLVVGNTMRPVADKLGISRAKLAFIVDSTAAPVGALALVTTWIGIELSYIQEGINAIGINQSAYSVFIGSIGSRFYPIFALIFVVMIIWMRRDYGPMLRSEQRARAGRAAVQNDAENEISAMDKDMEVAPHVVPKWYNAIIPVGILILGTVAGLFYTGYQSDIWSDVSTSLGSKLMSTVGAADSFKALLWSSVSGVIVALALTVGQRILTLQKTMDGLVNGFKMMLPAILILVLAWALALITQHFHTATFVSNLLISADVSPRLIPALTFVLAAIIAFSTGTSWGTMAILYPLILPVSWALTTTHGYSEAESIAIFYNVVSCILAGAVMGDHCSPISDTTILSSLSSGCNHIEHVRTQMPYALTVAGVSLFVGTIPLSFGVPLWIVFPSGILTLWLILKYLGKEV